MVGKGFCEESIPDAIVEHVTLARDGFVTVHAIIPGVGITSTKQFDPTSRPEPTAHEYVVAFSVAGVLAPGMSQVFCAVKVPLLQVERPPTLAAGVASGKVSAETQFVLVRVPAIQL